MEGRLVYVSTKAKLKNQLDTAYELYRQKKIPEALTAFAAIQGVDAVIGMARCHVSVNDLEAALDILAGFDIRTLKRNEERCFFHTLAVIYQKQGNFTQAKQTLLRIADQGHVETQYAWLRLYEAGKKDAAAIKKCKQIKKEFPTHVNTYLSHGVLLHEAERYQDAIDSLLPLLHEDSALVKEQFPALRIRQLSIAYVIASIAYTDLGQYTLAFKYAKKAVNTDNKYAIAWSVCGHCYQRSSEQGALKKAKRCFDMAKLYDPQRFNRNHPLPTSFPNRMIDIEEDDNEYDDYLIKANQQSVINYKAQSDALEYKEGSESFKTILLKQPGSPRQEDEEEEIQQDPISYKDVLMDEFEQIIPDITPGPYKAALMKPATKKQSTTISSQAMLTANLTKHKLQGMENSNDVPTASSKPDCNNVPNNWWESESDKNVVSFSNLSVQPSFSAPIDRDEDVLDSWEDETDLVEQPVVAQSGSLKNSKEIILFKQQPTVQPTGPGINIPRPGQNT